jgi:hypothetical protein
VLNFQSGNYNDYKFKITSKLDKQLTVATAAKYAATCADNYGLYKTTSKVEAIDYAAESAKCAVSSDAPNTAYYASKSAKYGALSAKNAGYPGHLKYTEFAKYANFIANYAITYNKQNNNEICARAAVNALYLDYYFRK